MTGGSGHMDSSSSDKADLTALVNQLQLIMGLFFKCFAYDDIDVTGAVIPMASRLVLMLEKEIKNDASNQQLGVVPTAFRISSFMPQLITIMYEQMKYPEDFKFDYEDEDEAEEEMFRTELRKLNQKLVRYCPQMSLQFLCDALSNLSLPLSSAPTNEVEASLRLVYHFCEGIHPPPGLKVAMKNDTFLQVLNALHSSDLSSHSHHEVVLLYYDITVRYNGILKTKTELLPDILSSMSGSKGLQHPHPRVRSRCCYFLLKLVKAMGSILRPFVETAVEGIQGNNDSINYKSILEKIELMSHLF